MIRRNFFQMLCAAFFGWLLPEKKKCQSIPYRKGKDGFFWAIGPQEVKAGDEIIVIGLDENRLWRATHYLNAQPTIFEGRPGLSCFLHGSKTDLLNPDNNLPYGKEKSEILR